MLPLSLFRVRNFAVANAATLTIYAGLMGSSFFLTLYLQQVAGYTALAAGFAGVPISLMLFFLSPRFGALHRASRPSAADERRADRRRAGAACCCSGSG